LGYCSPAGRRNARDLPPAARRADAWRDVERFKRQLADGGITPENQEGALRSRDVEAAQAIVGEHVLPEWHASVQAPRAFQVLAQEIADAIYAARGGALMARR